MSEATLKQIANDLADVKKRVIRIEDELVDLSLYEVRPEYLKKLKRIEKQKGISFKNISELRKIIEG